MLHIMKLQAEPFYKILKGKKTIEMRLYDEKRQKVHKNDEILFNYDDFSVLTKVIDLYVFKDFEELYHHLEFSDLGYSNSDKISYHDMEKFYSKEDIKKYGVVGIKIKVIK